MVGAHNSRYVCFDGQHASVEPPTTSPLPRHYKVSRPDPAPCGPGLQLLPDILTGVARERDGPSAYNQPSIDIAVFEPALGNSPIVPIYVPLITRYRPPADVVLQSECGLLSTSPRRTVRVSAFLPALGRVYTEEPNSLSVNLDRVAIDHARHARDLSPLSKCHGRC